MKLLAFVSFALVLVGGSTLVLGSEAALRKQPPAKPVAVQEPRDAPPRRAPPAGVFAPLFVRENAERCGLTAEQLAALDRLEEESRAVIQTTHVVAAPLAEEIAAAFETPRIDEEALLPAIDALLEQESRAHRAQLLLFVRVRNLLTEAQQKELGEIHDRLVF